MKWLHEISLPDRVYGPNLTLKVAEALAEEGLALYLYGSSSETANRFAENLREKYPGLVIAGVEPSKFRRLSEEEVQGVIDRIRDSGAHAVAVGLGCPRQEIWAYEYRDALSMPILAVGAAFDFHAGTVKQAPAVMQATGLEWLFRLVQEPRRLWRRYLILNPLYLWRIFLQWVAVRVPDVSMPDGTEPRERFG